MSEKKIGALETIRKQIEDITFEDPCFHVTFCDENGANSARLPYGLVLQIGSIVEFHYDKYLVCKIDYVNKTIIASKTRFQIINGDTDIVN